MTRTSIILISILFLCFSLFAQTTFQDKITLKTGEVYVGEIVVRNQDMVMIKTPNGNRYQFPLSEIKELGKEKIVLSEKIKPDVVEGKRGEDNFCGMIELAGGISQSKYVFGSSLNTQVSLLFGTKKIKGKNIFLGAGVGYNSTHPVGSQEPVRFLPLFFRLQNTLTSKRTAPYLGMDVGYAFGLKTNYSGGVLVKLSAGVTHKLNPKTSLSAGLFAGVQSLSGQLTEVNELGVYSYQGKTSMKSAGLKIGLSF